MYQGDPIVTKSGRILTEADIQARWRLILPGSRISMRRHLPKGRWTKELLDRLSWRELSEIARYPYRGSKARAKRRIHKLERVAADDEIRNQQEGRP